MICANFKAVRCGCENLTTFFTQGQVHYQNSQLYAIFYVNDHECAACFNFLKMSSFQVRANKISANQVSAVSLNMHRLSLKKNEAIFYGNEFAVSIILLLAVNLLRLVVKQKRSVT